MMKSLKAIQSVAYLALLFTSTAQAQQYSQQIIGSGMDFAVRGHGVAAADYDNDGYIDLYFVTKNVNSNNSGGAPNFLFRNLGNGTFIDVAKAAGVVGIIDTVYSGSQRVNINYGAFWADFDNDGDADLLLTNKGMNELYENNGDGTFRDITKASGLGERYRESTSAAWFDYDLDGDLDLYVSNYGLYGLILSAKNEFYQNNGDGTFTDITDMAGVGGAEENASQRIQSDWTYTTLIVDVNEDAYPDLYCINDFGGNILFVNQQDGTFKEATGEYRLSDPGHGMGGALGDFDNDGHFDIYVTNIEDGYAEWNRLFKHQPNKQYEDISTSVGTALAYWAWGTEFFDYDLDGWLDLFVVNGQNGEPMKNAFFRNRGDGTFEDIAEQTGTNSTAEARGLCIADFNNDGRLDIFASNYYTRAHYYINTAQGGNYLKINLTGTQSNRDGYGTIVSAEANGRSFYRINDGIHYLGQSKRPVHFGLGDATTIDRLTVKWPLGLEQQFTNIAANRTIAITEGSDEIREVVTSIQSSTDLQPGNYSLQSYPNPVQIGAHIEINLPQREHVRVEIYDILGKKVRSIAQEQLSAGNHTLRWEAVDDAGQRLVNGVYFIRVQTNTTHFSKAILVVK